MACMTSSAKQLVAFVLIAALLLAGCGSDSSDSSDSSASAATVSDIADSELTTDTTTDEDAPDSAETVATTEPVVVEAEGDAPEPTVLATPVAVTLEPETAEPASAETDTASTDSASNDPVAVANPDYLGGYVYVDEGFGTMVTVTVNGDGRTIASNALPNHETGQFPNAGNPNTISEQAKTWTYTTTPTYVGTPSIVREPGVALNGVKFEPDTAERVNCATGEQYRIEGLQDTFDLGMDFNNAHVQPTGEYHYHGVSDLLVEAYDNDEDLVLVGFAADGFLMYYSKSGSYESSYVLSTEVRTGTDCTYRDNAVEVAGTTADGTYASDWVYVDGLGELDQCNGTIVDGTYAYIVTEEYPFVPRCLMGEAASATSGPGGAGGAEPTQGGQGAAGGPGAGGPPDLDNVASILGIARAELEAALGTPPPDLAQAAAALGITEAELQAALFG